MEALELKTKREAWAFIRGLTPGEHSVTCSDKQSVGHIKTAAFEYKQAYNAVTFGVQDEHAFDATVWNRQANPVLVLSGPVIGECLIVIKPHDWIEFGYKAHNDRGELRGLVDQVKPGEQVTIEGDARTVAAVRQLCVGRPLTVTRIENGCIVSVDDGEPALAERVREAIKTAHNIGIALIDVEPDRLQYVRSVVSRESKRAGLQVLTRYLGSALELLPMTVEPKPDLLKRIDDAIEVLKQIRREVALIHDKNEQTREIL